MNRATYVEILKNEFIKRRSKNVFYSLRNFAKDIDLDPMHLSNILHNKRGLSRAKAEDIAPKLQIGYAERRKFILLVTAVSSRSKFKKNLARMGLRNDEIVRRQRLIHR